MKFKDRDGRTVFLETPYVYQIPDNFILERFIELLDENPRRLAETFAEMGREDLTGEPVAQ